MDYRQEQAIQILEIVAEAHGVRIDRAEVTLWLSAFNISCSEDMLAWLYASGARSGMKMGFFDCGMDDVAAFARQGLPLILPPCRESVSGGAQWLVVTRYRRGRFYVHQPHDGGRGEWMSRKHLMRVAGMETSEERARWLVAQPLTAEFGAEPGDSPKPFYRLLRLFRADAGDVWSMFVFAVITGVLTLAAPLAVEALVNTVAFGRYLQPIVMLALLLFVFLAFAAALNALLFIMAEIIQRRFYVRISEDLAYRLPRVQAAALDDRHGPELANRFLDVANIQKASASLLLDGMSLVISGLIGLIVLAFYHPFLLGFDIVMLSMMAFIIFGLGRGAVGTSTSESKSKYKLTAWLQELTRNPTAFSMHGGQRFAIDRVDKLAVEYHDYRRKHFRILMRQVSFALGMQAVASTVLLGLGGWLVVSGELTLGQLVAAELIVSVVVGSFAKVGKHLESYYDLLASVGKIGDLLDLPMERPGGPVQVDAAGPARIDIHGVSVAVGGKTIVTSWSGTAACGGLTVLWGAGGCGKSLMLDAIATRRPCVTGHIDIDGNELTQLDVETLRQQIGFSRDCEVFHGTIAENVHLYRPHIRVHDVRDALKLVGLIDEVRSLSEGLDTELTTHGAPLSRSQALRLMIARAIVGRPRVLILDGTLDSLPDAAAEKILDRLTEQPQPWTLLVATGRDAIRARADTVWEMAARGAVRSSG